MEYSVWHVLDFVHDIVLSSYEMYFKVDDFFLTCVEPSVAEDYLWYMKLFGACPLYHFTFCILLHSIF